MENLTIENTLSKYLTLQEQALILEAGNDFDNDIVDYKNNIYPMESWLTVRLLNRYLNILNVYIGYRALGKADKEDKIKLRQFRLENKLRCKAARLLLIAIKKYLIDLYKDSHPELKYLNFMNVKTFYGSLITEENKSFDYLAENIDKYYDLGFSKGLEKAKISYQLN